MKDTELIDLYFSRSEEAISETEARYGSFCFGIAMHILENHQDAEECVYDTYLKVWNSIPPTRPDSFPAYIGRIVRNTALHRYEKAHTQKRGNGNTELMLSELEECIGTQGEDIIDRLAVRDAINRFLGELSPEQRSIFIRRYWGGEPVAEIALKLGMNEGKVESSLFRLRKKLKLNLTKAGITI